MDVWVIAAAAGAGYVAQHLKNLTRVKNKSLDLSVENLDLVTPKSPVVREKIEHGSHPLRRVLWRKSVGDDISSSGEMASTSGYEDENLVMNGDISTFNIASNFSSLVELRNKEDVQQDWEGRLLPSEADEVFACDSLPDPSSSDRVVSCDFRRNRGSLRSRRVKSQFIKPRTSLESCLMAQLYGEHMEIEEYTYSLRSSQKPSARPFLVSDGSRVISTARHESVNEPIGTGKFKLRENTCSRENDIVLGVPKLRDKAVASQKKAKGGKRKEQALRRTDSSKIANGNGASERAMLFYLGITMGMMSSFLANKQETEKLNKMLKQTENLVQDLQEELEMKDSLTVKEITTENYEPQDVHNDCYPDESVHALAVEQNYNEENRDKKADGESLSIIEAELEAELERLESNINSSRLERKLSRLTELDPDVESGFHGEKLRCKLFGSNAGKQAYADRDGSNCSVHYSVSPKELSLRLHEVIQSRLEERVKELETALQNTHRKLKHMESKHNDTTSCSIEEEEDSHLIIDEQESVDEAVIINLSGEALSAYNEAYKELQFGFENDSDDDREMVFDEERTEEDVLDIVCSSSRDESEEDEMEKLLIRQIVEKAKQGSPAVLKAQRALLSTHEN